jgi:hypothetical protein
MSFTKGKQKTGGRQKGTPNQTTKEIKDTLQLIIEGEMQYIPETLELIRERSPIAYLNTLISIAEYVIPKQSRVDSIVEMQTEIKPITINLDSSINSNENNY